MKIKSLLNIYCCLLQFRQTSSLRKISTQPAVAHIERDCSSVCILSKIFIMISIMDRHYILNRTAADNETPLLRMSELLSIQSLRNFNVPASRCSAIACVSDGCWQLKIINFHFAKKNGDECSSRSVIVSFWGRWCGDGWIAWNDRLQFIDCEILRIYYEIHLQWHREWSIGWLDELLRRANHRWRDEWRNRPKFMQCNFWIEIIEWIQRMNGGRLIACLIKNYHSSRLRLGWMSNVNNGFPSPLHSHFAFPQPAYSGVVGMHSKWNNYKWQNERARRPTQWKPCALSVWLWCWLRSRNNKFRPEHSGSVKIKWNLFGNMLDFRLLVTCLSPVRDVPPRWSSYFQSGPSVFLEHFGLSSKRRGNGTISLRRL